MKLFLIILSFLLISNAFAGNKTDSSVCHGYYITNSNEKRNADFLIENSVPGILSLQQKVLVRNTDGSSTALYPGEIKRFEIEELKFDPTVRQNLVYLDDKKRFQAGELKFDSSMHDSTASFHMYYHNVKFVSVAIKKKRTTDTLFLYCSRESEFITMLAYLAANKSQDQLLVRQRVCLNNTTQKILGQGPNERKCLRDFFSDDPLLASLINSRNFQYLRDFQTLLHEYEQWKLKQELLAKNDTNDPIFRNYLGSGNDTSYVLKAYIDAEKNYKPRGFGKALLLSSVSTILGGLVYTLVINSKEPTDEKLNFPDPVLKANPVYNKAYISWAKRIRTNRLKKGAIIGGVIIFPILVIAGSYLVS